jgi:hypothetical protein
MTLLFVVLPLAVLLIIDVGGAAWWIRRSALMNNGVPVTGQVIRLNISVTQYADSRSSTWGSSSTDIRPVVRFITQAGEQITTSPMRSGVDKLLIIGEPVNIRYSPANPARCVVDQRGAYHGAAIVLVPMVLGNIFLIGFIIVAEQMFAFAQM